MSDEPKQSDSIILTTSKPENILKIDFSAKIVMHPSEDENIEAKNREFSLFGTMKIKAGSDEEMVEEIKVHKCRANNISIDEYVCNLLETMVEKTPSGKRFGA